jgi:threonine/homoserine/homoserine lactone efflux protein
MDLSLFWKGVLIGLAIAAPVGPIGVLCIRRTLADGRLAGFVVGMGAATADAVYGAVAALGISAVSSRLVAQQDLIRIAGGALLVVLGWRILRAAPAVSAARVQGRGMLGVYASALVLTLTNPATILFYVAVFTGIGLAEAAERHSSALVVVLGVFLGSAAWWLFLSSAMSMFRRALTPSRLIWINRLSGGILISFGLLAAASVTR